MAINLYAVEETLKEVYPHGHTGFIGLSIDEMALHSRKNHDYARGGHPLGNFKRRASIYSNYPGLDLGDPTVVALVDAMKQLDAALWMKCQGYSGDVEGITSRLSDVSVYAKLAILIEGDKLDANNTAGNTDTDGKENTETSSEWYEQPQNSIPIES